MASQAVRNWLYYGDNLDVMREHIRDESVDLVYLDPPFNSKRAYNVIFSRNDVAPVDNAAQIQAFDDTWRWTNDTGQKYQEYVAGEMPVTVANALKAFYTLLGGNDAMAYLVKMAPRLVELRRVLKPTGSLYLHCDPTMSHYLKLMLDAVFGPVGFCNEIAWMRAGAKNDPLRYGRCHDVILFYAAGRAHTWNYLYTPFDQRSIEKNYTHVEPDTGRRYRRGDLTAGKPGGDVDFEWRGVRPYKGRHWAYSREKLDQMCEDGRIEFRKTGMPVYKRYLDEQPGVPLQDIWTDVRLTSADKERIGFSTQKPLALLQRIIEASSEPGDLVLDPFCGCGTTIDAAQRLGRQWIGIDITFIAIDIIEKRLSHVYGDPVSETYEISGIPRDLASARRLLRQSHFDFERWAVSLVNAEPKAKPGKDKGIDGVGRFQIGGRPDGKLLVSVKGGKTVTPQYVRELIGTVTANKAQMGILITLGEPSRGVRDATYGSGAYTWPDTNQTYPVVQVISIGELLRGIRPETPPMTRPYNLRTARAAQRGPAPEGAALDAAQLLTRRVLVHCRATDIEPVLGLIKDRRSGLVLTGTRGAGVASRLRQALQCECPILLDPAAYETETATAQEPFRIADNVRRARTLDQYLRELRRSGADAVLTPTRYIREADSASLNAVLRTADSLPPWAVITLPLDTAWISQACIGMLIQMLRTSAPLKAVMLGGQPSGRTPEGLANLRRLMAEVPNVALFRTDLAAFDALTYGATCGAIGTSSALRQIIPPSKSPFNDRPDEEPSAAPDVLVSDLVAYVPGSALAHSFGDGPPPMCDCRYCGRRRLTSFLGRHDWRDAALHGVAVWTDWLPGLVTKLSLAERQEYWGQLCRRGIEGHAIYNRRAADPADIFAPDPLLRSWASESTLQQPANFPIEHRST